MALNNDDGSITPGVVEVEVHTFEGIAPPDSLKDGSTVILTEKRFKAKLRAKQVRMVIHMPTAEGPVVKREFILDGTDIEIAGDVRSTEVLP